MKSSSSASTSDSANFTSLLRAVFDDNVENALIAIRRGEMVVVADPPDRENEGDLIFAAEKATPQTLAFMVRHTSGLICVGPSSPLRISSRTAAARSDW